MHDTIEYLKGEKVAFLTKYGQTIGVTNVVPIRDFVIVVMQLALRKSPTTTTLEVLKEAVNSYVEESQLGIESKQQEILIISLFARREELRKIFTQLIFQQTADKHLVDYNYNIEVRE